MEINGTSNVVYKDFPICKKLTNNGELKIYEDSEALAQAVKIWLSADKGEKIRNLSGGILSPFLGKMMDDDVAKDMEVTIRDGLTKDFKPNLTIVYLKVTPNYQRNVWIIDIAGFNADLAVGINTNVIISNL